MGETFPQGNALARPSPRWTRIGCRKTRDPCKRIGRRKGITPDRYYSFRLLRDEEEMGGSNQKHAQSLMEELIRDSVEREPKRGG